jgi:hypothetical protein
MKIREIRIKVNAPKNSKQVLRRKARIIVVEGPARRPDDCLTLNPGGDSSGKLRSRCTHAAFRIRSRMFGARSSLSLETSLSLNPLHSTRTQPFWIRNNSRLRPGADSMVAEASDRWNQVQTPQIRVVAKVPKELHPKICGNLTITSSFRPRNRGACRAYQATGMCGAGRVVDPRFWSELLGIWRHISCRRLPSKRRETMLGSACDEGLHYWTGCKNL